MENYKLVLPEHLNHYGFLFGGQLLKWVDEVAYIAANLEFPGNDFVTVSMDDVHFRQSIGNGDILRFDVRKTRLGNTSVSYEVKVHAQGGALREALFDTRITFVSVDDEGRKQPVRQPD